MSEKETYFTIFLSIYYVYSKGKTGEFQKRSYKYKIKRREVLVYGKQLILFTRNIFDAIYSSPRISTRSLWLERPRSIPGTNKSFALLSLAFGTIELGNRLAGSESV